MAGRIEDYAIVGDMQSAALVSSDGSVDWLCLPRFDSEACFAALLGRQDHGCWRIAPEDELEGRGGATVRRRYAGDTLILQTLWLRTPVNLIPQGLAHTAAFAVSAGQIVPSADRRHVGGRRARGL